MNMKKYTVSVYITDIETAKTTLRETFEIEAEDMGIADNITTEMLEAKGYDAVDVFFSVRDIVEKA